MTRRERLRDATLREIKDVARAHLREHGPSGISLRAVARDMGMTAPALYRYYASLDELILAMSADYKNEVCDALEAARDALPTDDIVGRLYAVSREFRRWALDHRSEFGLVFGGPVPGIELKDDDGGLGGVRFGGIFMELCARLWERERFPVPDDESIPADLRRQLEYFGANCGADRLGLPLGFLSVFSSCWIRLYGVVTMEIFGHGMYEDFEPLFEAELAGIAATLWAVRRD